LIKHLPRDGALGRAVLGEAKATWTQDTDLLMVIGNILIRANSEKPKDSDLLHPPE